MTIQCMNEVPSITEFQKYYDNKVKRLYVKLPVYILAVYRDGIWGSRSGAILVFTDFTPVKDAAIAQPRQLVASLPREFYIQDQKLDPAYLYSTSMSAGQFSDVASQLKYVRVVQSQLEVDETANLEQKGIFANLEFQVTVRKSADHPTEPTIHGLSGFLRNIVFVRTKHQAATLASSSQPFQKLVTRFKRLAAPSVYQRANALLDLEDVINSEAMISQAPTEAHPTQPPTKKRLTGAGLLFPPPDSDSEGDSMNPTQPTQPAQNSSLSQIPLDSQPRRTTQVVHSPDNSRIIPFTRPKKHTPQPANRGSTPPTIDSLNEFLVNKSSIGHLNEIVDSLKASSNNVFQIDAYIKGMVPWTPVIIKPFGRTLKTTNFKLLLQDSAGHALTVEFHTTNELCSFLEVREVEELYKKMATIEESFEKLINSPTTLRKNIKLKRKFVPLESNPKIIYPYWACTNRIHELT